MKHAKLLIFLFLFLLSIGMASATTFHSGSGGTFAPPPPSPIDANFQGADPSVQFTTDLLVKPAIGVSLLSGSVLTGNPAALKSGDVVCQGSSVYISPSVSAQWGLRPFDISGVYDCMNPDPAVCPTELRPLNVVTLSNSIKWLNPTSFSNEQSYGNDAVPLSGDAGVSAYKKLGAFYPEPVTYALFSVGGIPSSRGDRGDSNVFCKGSIVVTDQGTAVGSPIQLPAPQPGPDSMDVGTYTVTLNQPGTHALDGRVTGLSCFGAMVDYPFDLTIPHIAINYYTHNAPSISDQYSPSVNLNVQSPGGTCSLSQLSSPKISSTSDNKFSIVGVTVTNNGANTVQVQTVSSSNPGYTANELYSNGFDQNACNQIFGGVCPPSDGFNSDISPQASTTLYVYLQVKTQNAGPTTLNFGAQSSKPICGQPEKCSLASSSIDTTNPGNNVASCKITPPQATLGTQEIGLFTVACSDSQGNPVACAGDQWSWSGLTGDFISKDNAQAKAYTTSSPGSSGKLQYISGAATCNSTVSVVNPTYQCAFSPPSAQLAASASQYFAFSCTKNGAPATPDSGFGYDIIGGLQGALSKSTITGTNFTASNNPSSGNLRGAGYFNVPNSNIIGAVALAPVTVTGPSTASCKIAPPRSALGTQEIGLFTVACSDSQGNPVACAGDQWSWSGLTGDFISKDNAQAKAYTTSSPGSSGKLQYTSGGATCNSNVSVVNPTYQCAFSPPSAQLSTSASQYFAFSCTKSGAPATPDQGSAYDIINGLQGTLTQSTIAGTNFTAGSASSGQVRGAGFFTVPNSNIIGAVALAPVTVEGGGGIPPTNITNATNITQVCPSCQPGPTPGSTQYCAIFGSGNLYPGSQTGQLLIGCNQNNNYQTTCDYVSWSLLQGSSPTLGFLPHATSGTTLIVPNSFGSGTIYAQVGSDKYCYFPYVVSSPQCLQVS